MSTDAAILSRLEAIERQNQRVLALLEKLTGAQPIELPSTSSRRGKYSQEQWKAIVKDPGILREMSRQDTSKRRKKAMTCGLRNTASEATA